MENKTENTALPLYKVLEGKRQRGTMEAVQFDSPHKDICIKLSEYKINGQWHFADRVCENFPDIETAQFAALAINNLSILADALQHIVNMTENTNTGMAIAINENAKAALANIS